MGQVDATLLIQHGRFGGRLELHALQALLDVHEDVPQRLVVVGNHHFGVDGFGVQAGASRFGIHGQPPGPGQVAFEKDLAADRGRGGGVHPGDHCGSFGPVDFIQIFIVDIHAAAGPCKESRQQRNGQAQVILQTHHKDLSDLMIIKLGSGQNRGSGDPITR